ncbi:MAG: zinc metallopeptidase [Clostridiales bacterium]|nr:zinc metallopeptidase [Clostridiales bacterium]
MPPFFYFDYTFLLLIPALIFTIWAQINVSTTFNKMNKFRTGMSGAEAARRILDANGLTHVRIERVSGRLTDHYDPRQSVIRLSESVYDNYSAGAVGVAAHEAGHAVQYAVGYAPIKLRTAIIPVTSFGSQAAMPLFLIGLIISAYSTTASSLGYTLMMTGIIFFSLAVLFQVITLPVEFNASRRALAALEGSGMLGREELSASGKVLRAAALTYVAALAVALLNLLRLILIATGGRRR